jgi:hypothetical protein
MHHGDGADQYSDGAHQHGDSAHQHSNGADHGSHSSDSGQSSDNSGADAAALRAGALLLAAVCAVTWAVGVAAARRYSARGSAVFCAGCLGAGLGHARLAAALVALRGARGGGSAALLALAVLGVVAIAALAIAAAVHAQFAVLVVAARGDGGGAYSEVARLNAAGEQHASASGSEAGTPRRSDSLRRFAGHTERARADSVGSSGSGTTSHSVSSPRFKPVPLPRQERLTILTDL